MATIDTSGDAGQTALADGNRASKDDLRFHLAGTLEEACALLGVVRSKNANLFVEQLCSRLQTLFMTCRTDVSTPRVPSDAADPADRVTVKHVKYVELCMDQLSKDVPTAAKPILPGGSEAAALLHVARTVVRRAERAAASLVRETDLGPVILPLLNRVSDYLFVLARFANARAGKADEPYNRDFPELKAL